MSLCSISDVINLVKARPEPKSMAIVGADDDHVFEAVIKAEDDNCIRPIFIGNKSRMMEMFTRYGYSKKDSALVYDVDGEMECSAKAVELVRNGEAAFIMKGMVNTQNLLRPILNKETGLNTGEVICSVVFMETPGYHKLMVISDSAVLVKPTLQQKAGIIRNCVSALQKLGIKQPKVAVLCANEVATPKQPETVEAAELQRMAETGTLGNCVLAGPISLDLAMDAESAASKGYDNPVAGDADILLVPNIEAGNILVKTLLTFAKAEGLGTIAGAKCPIVITSRSSCMEDKYRSIILNAALA